MCIAVLWYGILGVIIWPFEFLFSPPTDFDFVVALHVSLFMRTFVHSIFYITSCFYVYLQCVILEVLGMRGLLSRAVVVRPVDPRIDISPHMLSHRFPFRCGLFGVMHAALFYVLSPFASFTYVLSNWWLSSFVKLHSDPFERHVHPVPLHQTVLHLCYRCWLHQWRFERRSVLVPVSPIRSK